MNDFISNSKNAKYLLAIGLLLIVLLPWILTRTHLFSFLDVTDTGEIGDTIGGITTPFLSLIGSALVYLALVAQINANEQIQQQFKAEGESRNINQLYSYLIDSINNFHFKGFHRIDDEGNEIEKEELNCKGSDAFYKLFEKIYCDFHDYEQELEGPVMAEVTSILLAMEQIVRLMEKSKLDSKPIIMDLLSHLFYFKVLGFLKGTPDCDLEPSHCSSCGKHHGLPDRMRQSIIYLRSHLQDPSEQTEVAVTEN
jgi:hypothetical protein